MRDLHGQSEHVVARVLAEGAVILGGLLILALVAATGPAWFDRHFLPDFFKDQSVRQHLADNIRVALVALAVVVLLVLRPRIGRFAAREGGVAVSAAGLRVALAVALALAVSEAVLRTSAWQSRHAAPIDREPIQQAHARLGWVLVPRRAGTRTVEGRTVEYALDAGGFRVRAPGVATDFDRGSVLFAGESIMLGTGLDWPDTVPALVESASGHQGVNLAVNGYATDQVYLRVADVLPRFRRPVAVVTLFAPSLLPRNLERDRPWLDDRLDWHPARVPWRLEALVHRLLRYSSTPRVEEGIRRTRAALEGIASLARQQGARALLLEPRYRPGTVVEDALGARLFDGLSLEPVRVDLDPAWRLPDEHPDARASRAMAAAVAARLAGTVRVHGAMDYTRPPANRGVTTPR